MAVSMVTWNMQGKSDNLDDKWVKHVKELVRNYKFVCLQECGKIPESIQRETPQPPPNAWPQWGRTPPPANLKVEYVVWNIGSQERPDLVYIFWAETDPQGGRVNLAVCSKNAPTGLLYAPGLQPNGRPSIGIEVHPDNVYTLHAFSPGGNDAPTLITNISSGPQPWYALGDYNREPTWTPPAGTLCPPDKETYVTQNGEKKKLDYMVRFGTEAETGRAQPEGPIWSDHAFVLYGEL